MTAASRRQSRMSFRESSLQHPSARDVAHNQPNNQESHQTGPGTPQNTVIRDEGVAS